MTRTLTLVDHIIWVIAGFLLGLLVMPGCTLPLPNIDGSSGNPFGNVPTMTVLIVEESSQRTALEKSNPKMISAMNSTIWKSYVTNQGGEFSVVDQDTFLQKNNKWATAFAKPRTSLPWVYTGKGRKGFTGPMPTGGLPDFMNKALIPVGGAPPP